MPKACIMIVDDSPEICLSASFVLENHGFSVLTANSLNLAKEQIKKNAIKLILLDMNYSLDTTSGEEGLSFLSWLQDSENDIPTVAMTAWSNVELAVKAMQSGAVDFIEKPWKNQRLLQIIKQQLTLSGLKTQNRKLQQQLEPPSQTEYVWRSACMLALIDEIKIVSNTDVSILLTGDNGTGKSQLAQIIHQNSMRKNESLISLNMGAISESLFESEMFGHKKGAFTDAKENRMGRFELAEKGTLFLDEIANIPLSQQAKLLRVLETGEYEVLGSSNTRQTDIRIISATNGNIKKLIEQEYFREDLYYRLNTIEFRVPPLTERAADIIPLSEFFIKQYGKKYQRKEFVLSETACKALVDYPWPGNIRELSHILERAVLLNKKEMIDCDSLNLLSNTKATSELSFMTLEAAEVKLIKMALQQTNQHVPQAAELLGLTKSSLYRRLEKYPHISQKITLCQS